MERSGTAKRRPNIIFQRGRFYLCDDWNIYLQFNSEFFRVTSPVYIHTNIDGRIRLYREKETNENHNTVEGAWRCGNITYLLDAEGHLNAALDNRRILLGEFV